MRSRRLLEKPALPVADQFIHSNACAIEKLNQNKGRAFRDMHCCGAQCTVSRQFGSDLAEKRLGLIDHQEAHGLPKSGKPMSRAAEAPPSSGSACAVFDRYPAKAGGE
jgi:hypothetical protein